MTNQQRPLSLSRSCPECGKVLAQLSRKFGAPPKTATEEWTVVEYLVSQGFRYYTIHLENGQHAQYPKTMKEAVEFVRTYRFAGTVGRGGEIPPNETDLCAICGKNKAATRDHVPPRGIFAKPLPGDLITVPACSSCNGGASKDDEAFRTYLSLHVGISNPSSASLWEKHVSRTIQHNKKLRNRLLSSMKPVHLTTESGIIIGRAMAGLWDSKAHDNVIERMIRGLYFHHYGSVLGDKAIVKVQWLKSLPKELKDESVTWSHNQIADGKFVYRFARAEDEAVSSAWIFQFYNRHWASGYSMPNTPLEMVR